MPACFTGISTIPTGLAAIDDAIARGSRLDWRELRDTADQDPAVRLRIARICNAKIADPKRNGTTSGMASL